MALSQPRRARLAPGRQLALLWVFCRIDDHLATAGLAALVRRESIYLEQRLSDPAPLITDCDFGL
jgi:hypothetical protein